MQSNGIPLCWKSAPLFSTDHILTLDKASGGAWPLFGLTEETVCHRVKTKPSVTAIRQTAAGLSRARQGLTPLDQLGLMSRTTSGTLRFSFLFTPCNAVTLPSLSPSCNVFLSLSVKSSLCLSLSLCLSNYSKRILLISPLSLLPKQGQSCNPFTAPLVNRFHPNNPERLTTRPRYCQGRGRNEEAECTREEEREPQKKREE